MIKINIPDSAWSTARMSLGEDLYEVEFKYNSRDERWRISLFYQGEPVIRGLKLMENFPLTYRYVLDNWQKDNDFYAVRVKQDGLMVGRDNTGIGKSYELVFVEAGEE